MFKLYGQFSPPRGPQGPMFRDDRSGAHEATFVSVFSLLLFLVLLVLFNILGG